MAAAHALMFRCPALFVVRVLPPGHAERYREFIDQTKDLKSFRGDSY
jgi:hypothetical protein